MERNTSELCSDTTWFWTCPVKNSLTDTFHFHSKRLCACWKKSFNPSWTMPTCPSVHRRTIPAAQTELSYSMSHTFCISPQISSKSCVYADYVIGYYLLSRKLCCFGNKLATIFESKFMQNFFHGKPHSFGFTSWHFSWFFSLNLSKVDRGSTQPGKHLFNGAVMDQKVDMAADFECINLTVIFQY